jgi:prepilin-type N-terminal cleavage/methylation domain-containing protein
MTSSSRPEPRRSAARQTRGFTLIELLVVMGIILVLISILLPAVTRAHRNAMRTSMMGDFAVISQALDAYRAQFGDYPRTGLGAPVGSTNPNTAVSGAAVLCWALVAPGPFLQDGAGQMNGTAVATPDNGAPGFRLRPSAQPQGDVKGPFISLDRFKLGTVTTSPTTPSITVNAVPASTTYDDTQTVLADRYGNVILYFPANVAASPTLALVGNYTPGSPPAPLPVYNYGDNSAYLTQSAGLSELTGKMFAYRLGNVSATSGGPWKIPPPTAAETAVVTPYLLWSAGPDGQFGPSLNSSSTTSGEDDDIVYPDQLLTIPAMQTP